MHIGLGIGLLTASRIQPDSPALSGATDTASGSTTGAGSVTTDMAGGTLYWVVTTSATAPSAAYVIAGNNHLGTAAVTSGSQAVSATGVQTLSPVPSGLTISTAYWIHYAQQIGVAKSNVASGDGFTTTAAGTGSPIGLLLTLTKAA